MTSWRALIVCLAAAAAAGAGAAAAAAADDSRIEPGAADGAEFGAEEVDGDVSPIRSGEDRNDLRGRFARAVDAVAHARGRLSAGAEPRVLVEGFGLDGEPEGERSAAVGDDNELLAVVRGVFKSYDVDVSGIREIIVAVFDDVVHMTGLQGRDVTALELADAYLEFEDDSRSHFFPAVLDEQRAMMDNALWAKMEEIDQLDEPEDPEMLRRLAELHENAPYGIDHFEGASLDAAELQCSRCITVADELHHAMRALAKHVYHSERPPFAKLSAPTDAEATALLADLCDSNMRAYDVSSTVVLGEPDGVGEGRLWAGEDPGLAYSSTPFGWADRVTASQERLVTDCRAIVAERLGELVEAAVRAETGGEPLAVSSASYASGVCVARGSCSAARLRRLHMGGISMHVHDHAGEIVTDGEDDMEEHDAPPPRVAVDADGGGGDDKPAASVEPDEWSSESGEHADADEVAVDEAAVDEFAPDEPPPDDGHVEDDVVERKRFYTTRRVPHDEL